MTREIALHCMKAYSELHSDLCELCPIYGQTGSDHCFEDALQYVIGMLEQEPKIGHWIANAPQYDMFNPQYICSECGNAHTRITPYCEMCGAKMIEPQERSDKE